MIKYSIFLLLISMNALAMSETCLIKQKNAASYFFAQSLGIIVQEVEVLRIQTEWTNNPADNIGTSIVTVLGDRPNRGLTEAIYTVKAKQVKSSDSCEILSVKQGR